MRLRLPRSCRDVPATNRKIASTCASCFDRVANIYIIPTLGPKVCKLLPTLYHLDPYRVGYFGSQGRAFAAQAGFCQMLLQACAICSCEFLFAHLETDFKQDFTNREATYGHG